MNSDDERGCGVGEVEIDSDVDDDGLGGPSSSSSSKGGGHQHADKRAHHNALERKRRDHIKESFTGLRDAIPTLAQGDKSSRAQILKKASEYISYMRKKTTSHQKDIEDLRMQNTRSTQCSRLHRTQSVPWAALEDQLRRRQ